MSSTIKKAILSFEAALMLIAAMCIFPVQNSHAYTETIRIGVEYNRAPFQYLNESGQCVGLHIELMDYIARQNNWKVEYIPYQSYMDCMEAMVDGYIDMVLGINTAYTILSELRGMVTMSDDFSSTIICMITSNETAREWNSTDDYSSFIGAYELNSVSHMYLSRWHIRRCYIEKNQVSLVQSLANKDTDVIFGSYDSLTYLLDNCYSNVGYTVIYSNITSMDYALMTRKSDSERLQTVNNTLTEMRSLGEYDAIYNHWIVDSARKKEQYIINVFIVLVVIILAAFAVISVLNWLLKRKVKEKTQELVLRMDQIGNENDFRSRIIEQSPSGMIYFENDYKVILANKIAKEICGKSLETVIAQDIRTLKVFGEIIEHCGGDLFAPRKKPKEFPSGVVSIENREETRNFRYSFSSNYKMNQVSGVLLTVDDITIEEAEKRKTIEEEKNKVLDRIIAGIAHEIKNPLMAIGLYASMIRSQEGNREFYDSFSKKVPHEVERINSLIEALINYARPIRGKKEFVDIANLIDDSVYLYRATAQNSGVHFATSAEEGLFIWAYGDKIKQSLINLIANGLEAIEQKMKTVRIEKPPELKVRAQRNGDQICISVYDEGVGMTPEEIEECSEPFYTTKVKGTGLGMSLAKQFVGDNGGKLIIRSEKGSYTEIIMQFQEAKR